MSEDDARKVEEVSSNMALPTEVVPEAILVKAKKIESLQLHRNEETCAPNNDIQDDACL